MFEIFPAIDLKDGQAVRLYKGDMQSAKIYGNPLDFAINFKKIGAKWLHLVDLNGAVQGSPKNFEIIKTIIKTTDIKIQIGGGIRTQDHIKQYFDLGVSRVILGSIALQDLNFTLKMAEKYPIAIGIDAKNEKVAIHGWKEVQNINAINFASQFKDSCIQAIICTDISKDGTLDGINLDFTIKIAKASGIDCIASGGIGSEEHLKNLQTSFTQHKIKGGVIIGKAFYEKKIDLEPFFNHSF